MFGLDWETFAAWAAMQEQEKSDPKIIKKKFVPRCTGCGRFMKLDKEGSHIVALGMYSHMKEKCLTNLVKKIQATHKNFELGLIKKYKAYYE